VVANLTATSEELSAALQAEAAREPTAFTLLVPPAGPRDEGPASERLGRALTQLREAGLEIDGVLGESDPMVAVSEVWDPRRFDEIVVCTLPIATSKWLRVGLPQRIAELTGAAVSHVIAHPRKGAVSTTTVPHLEARHPNPLLAPIEAIGWRVALRPQRPLAAGNAVTTRAGSDRGGPTR
jgi:hypothetical protein